MELFWPLIDWFNPKAQKHSFVISVLSSHWLILHKKDYYFWPLIFNPMAQKHSFVISFSFLVGQLLSSSLFSIQNSPPQSLSSPLQSANTHEIKIHITPIRSSSPPIRMAPSPPWCLLRESSSVLLLRPPSPWSLVLWFGGEDEGVKGDDVMKKEEEDAAEVARRWQRKKTRRRRWWYWRTRHGGRSRCGSEKGVLSLRHEARGGQARRRGSNT